VPHELWARSGRRPVARHSGEEESPEFTGICIAGYVFRLGLREVKVERSPRHCDTSAIVLTFTPAKPDSLISGTVLVRTQHGPIGSGCRCQTTHLKN